MFAPVVRKICFLTLLFTCYHAFSQNGRQVIKEMHDKYYGKWHKTFTFVQTTEFYRNDTLRRTDTWYEAASFPYNFRIDFGDPKKGNSVIYKKDSTYHFQNGTLQLTEAGTNPFTFLLGGMYAVSFDEALSKFNADGYDLSKAYETEWLGKNVIVVGAAKGDTISKQFWIDKKDKYVVRTIEKVKETLVDAHMLDHMKIGNAWSETKVNIFFNGKLRQVEKYFNIKDDIKVDERLFDPLQIGKVFWTQ